MNEFEQIKESMRLIEEASMIEVNLIDVMRDKVPALIHMQNGDIDEYLNAKGMTVGEYVEFINSKEINDQVMGGTYGYGLKGETVAERIDMSKELNAAFYKALEKVLSDVVAEYATQELRSLLEDVLPTSVKIPSTLDVKENNFMIKIPLTMEELEEHLDSRPQEWYDAAVRTFAENLNILPSAEGIISDVNVATVFSKLF